MGAGVEAFVAAVEEALPCLFTEIEPRLRTATLPGSHTRIDVDEGSALFALATPIEDAHDGLPAEDLLDLLAFNFPNDLTRSSFLAGGRGAGHLVLTAVLPLRGLGADEAVRAVLDQIAAALALRERIAERRNSRAARGDDHHA